MKRFCLIFITHWTNLIAMLLALGIVLVLVLLSLHRRKRSAKSGKHTRPAVPRRCVSEMKSRSAFRKESNTCCSTSCCCDESSPSECELVFESEEEEEELDATLDSYEYK